MKIVLDTKVLLSGLLKPFGPPARVLKVVSGRQVELLVDDRVMLECQDVLTRSRFHLEQQAVEAVLDFMVCSAHHVAAAAQPVNLPDPDDLPFLEVAITGTADALVTGHANPFPLSACGGVPVLSPQGFLAAWQRQQARDR